MDFEGPFLLPRLPPKGEGACACMRPRIHEAFRQCGARKQYYACVNDVLTAARRGGSVNGAGARYILTCIARLVELYAVRDGYVPRADPIRFLRRAFSVDDAVAVALLHAAIATGIVEHACDGGALRLGPSGLQFLLREDGDKTIHWCLIDGCRMFDCFLPASDADAEWRRRWRAAIGAPDDA